MPLRRHHLDQLFERPWHGGHPLRRRVGRPRQWIMFLILLMLLGIIFGYGYVTNPTRVREMAQSYLSQILGGPVEVGNATLSIFQGLRLDNVKVMVDHSNRPDSVLLTAQSFILRYNPKAMLRGELEARQIIAINPRLFLSEDLDTGTRNYQRLIRRGRAVSRPSTRQGRPAVLPEILLRNAEVEYSEISHDQYHVLGTMRIDGQLGPTDIPNEYHFAVQSRNSSQGIGPVASGTLRMDSGVIEAKLSNFQFDQALMNLLPAEVRQWGQDHDLSGRVDVPVVQYMPPKNGGKARFLVEVSPRDVSMSVHPRQWMGGEELRRRALLGKTWQFMRGSGLAMRGQADLQANLVQVTPVHLDHVSGSFVFTPEGIDVKDLTGRVEGNALKIDGHISGYSPDAAMKLRLSSLDTENLYLGPSPRFVSALPGDLRELYEHLRPQGTCRLWAEVTRAAPDEAVGVRGEVDILDGQFVFDLFPYPLRKATGRITFGPDPVTGIDRCDIRDLRGLGMPDGPNRNVAVAINASVVPLAGNAEVNVRVEASHVVAEPRLIAAMPPEVKETLKLFAAADQAYPSFSGGFVCHVHRPPGPHKKWTFTVDLNIDDSRGAFAYFPYPLEHVKGRLHIGEHFVDIDHMTMLKDKTSLVVNGRVDFGNDRPVRPDLTITARDVPLDKTFIAALPPQNRPWVVKAGVEGTISIDGRVSRPGDRLPITYNLDVGLRNGSVWPAGTTFAVGDVTAQMQITPDQLKLNEFHGRRGQAVLSASGILSDLERHPHLTLRADGTNLKMEQPLYQLLPAGAKQAWDEVRPVGTLDAALTCEADLGSPPTTAPATAAADSASQPASTQPAHPTFELVLRPVKLSMTPQVVPYRMDDLGGALRITDKGVVIENMTARHGPAKIALSGASPGGNQAPWQLALKVSDAPIDSDFKEALPATLRELFDALKLHGTLSMRFDKLTYRGGREPDIDFTGDVSFKDASLETGVTLEAVNGTIDLAGAVRQGRLSQLSGKLYFPSLTMAQRPVKDLRALLSKPSDRDLLQMSQIQATVAGGEMAGQIDLNLPHNGPSRYTLGIVLRNADVQTLAGDAEQDLRGRVSASLSLEGDWSDPSSRRGRGDVTASGKDMYRIPLLLGLMQVTNLSLPISQPFSEATVRYSVEGDHVTFDQIELRSNTMTMQGSGQLDFKSKTVGLSFVVDNPNAIKLPFITDLFNGFKQELLQIHVNGSIQRASAGGAPAGTYQTTVDKVYPQAQSGK